MDFYYIHKEDINGHFFWSHTDGGYWTDDLGDATAYTRWEKETEGLVDGSEWVTESVAEYIME